MNDWVNLTDHENDKIKRDPILYTKVNVVYLTYTHTIYLFFSHNYFNFISSSRKSLEKKSLKNDVETEILFIIEKIECMFMNRLTTSKTLYIITRITISKFESNTLINLINFKIEFPKTFLPVEY